MESHDPGITQTKPTPAPGIGVCGQFVGSRKICEYSITTGAVSSSDSLLSSHLTDLESTISVLLPMIPIDTELPLSERKAKFGEAYLRSVAAVAGYDATRPDTDYDSIDMIVSSREGVRRKLEFQVKCTARPIISDEVFTFSLSRKNYDDLRSPTIIPRLLLVVTVPERIQDWLAQNHKRMHFRRCGYWHSLKGSSPTGNTSNVTVTIGRKNLLTPEALIDLMNQSLDGLV